MKTKTVPMARAIAAVVLGCGYTAITMYHFGKGLLLKQAFDFELEKTEAMFRNPVGSNIRISR